MSKEQEAEKRLVDFVKAHIKNGRFECKTLYDANISLFVDPQDDALLTIEQLGSERLFVIYDVNTCERRIG